MSIYFASSGKPGNDDDDDDDFWIVITTLRLCAPSRCLLRCTVPPRFQCSRSGKLSSISATRRFASRDQTFNCANNPRALSFPVQLTSNLPIFNNEFHLSFLSQSCSSWSVNYCSICRPRLPSCPSSLTSSQTQSIPPALLGSTTTITEQVHLKN